MKALTYQFFCIRQCFTFQINIDFVRRSIRKLIERQNVWEFAEYIGNVFLPSAQFYENFLIRRLFKRLSETEPYLNTQFHTENFFFHKINWYISHNWRSLCFDLSHFHLITFHSRWLQNSDKLNFDQRTESEIFHLLFQSLNLIKNPNS